MTNEFFAATRPDGSAVRVPFPLDVALEDRAAYMATAPLPEPEPGADAPVPDTPSED